MLAIPALLAVAAFATADKVAVVGLRPLQPLVGGWKATGTPDGTRDERQKGFWAETLSCEYRFDGRNPRLHVTFEKGKHFARWELRPAGGGYELTATTPAQETRTYTGSLAVGKQKEQVLTLDRPAGGQTERLVVTLLHHNRFLYRFETKPAGTSAFARKYQVGATKDGESFAQVPKGPECIVSGGLAKIAVSHKGKTYHVCCSGCRDAFKDDPEKYIKEFEAQKK